MSEESESLDACIGHNVPAQERLTTMFLTFRTPSDTDPCIFQGAFLAQQCPTVLCFRRMRGDEPSTFPPGEWYESCSTYHRSVPSPTSAHREGLCRQDWLGRGDQSGGADRDGRRSRDYCAWHDPRYLEWTQSAVSLGRVLCPPRHGIAV